MSTDFSTGNLAVTSIEPRDSTTSSPFHDIATRWIKERRISVKDVERLLGPQLEVFGPELGKIERPSSWQEFVSTFGAWKEIDTDALKRRIQADRDSDTRGYGNS